jgi:predicted PurR-regulated permease PerM
MNQPPPPGFPNWSTRQVVIATIFIVSVGLCFWLLYRFSGIVFILFVAIVLGTAIRPLVDWLNSRGVPRSAGVLIVYLLLLSLAVGVVILIAPIVADQATSISQNIPKYYDTIRDGIITSHSRILQRIAIQLPPNLNNLLNTTQPPQSGEMLNRVAQFFSYAGAIAHALVILGAVFLLGFYWTLESERIIRGTFLWLPSDRRDDMRELIKNIETKVGGFVAGQATLCLSIAVLSLISYLLIGLPYALALAILAGLLEAVPIFGPTLGAIAPLVIAFSISPTKAILVLIAHVIIQTSENYILVPRIMSRSVGVNPIVTLLALAAFTALLGLPGAFLAVPMAAIIQLILDRFFIKPGPVEAEPITGRDQLSLLRYEAQTLAQDMRNQYRTKENKVEESSDTVENAIESIAMDLDRLLAQVGQKENGG